MRRFSFISAIVGIILGLIASKLLALQGFTLIPWAIAGLLVGSIGRSRKDALKIGAVYGFCLGFVFMAAAYNGSEAVVTKIPFFVLMGIIIAICGGVLSFSGYFLRIKIWKK